VFPEKWKKVFSARKHLVEEPESHMGEKTRHGTGDRYDKGAAIESPESSTEKNAGGQPHAFSDEVILLRT
jgi:hypothetical protein